MADSIYNPEYVKVLFNRMSKSYERINYITSFGFSIRWRTRFLEPLQSTTAKIEIIDLLKGMGETWGAVKAKFPNAKLTLLTFQLRCLRTPRQKVKNTLTAEYSCWSRTF